MRTKLVSGNNRSGQYAAAAVTQAPLESQRLRAVEDAFASLPERYLGADPGFSASYRIELDDLGLSWAVELNEMGCEVTASPKSDPDVVIGTDAATWLELREGRLSGLDAFRSRRLCARGNLDLAVAFEGFFRLPNGRPPLLRIHEVQAGKAKISTLTAEGIKRAHLVGNSLGGRIALEVGLSAPERVRSLSMLCPSMAWRRHRE